MRRSKIIWSGLLSLWVAGCAILYAHLTPQTPSSAAPQSQLLIAAASSLQSALQETHLFYQATEKMSHKLCYNFAASGTLQQQIEQGAPIDLFISAATKQIEALDQKSLLIPGSIQNLLTNQLVMIVSKQSSLNLTNFQQLTQEQVKRIAIGEPRTVPAGQYATEVFQNLGILNPIQSKFVFNNNVKAVLTAVESGEVDAGIVYLTDAKTSDKVRIATIAPETLHSPIRYPIAILKSSHSPKAAQQYLNFLKSETAQNIFAKYGFGIAKS